MPKVPDKMTDSQRRGRYAWKKIMLAAAVLALGGGLMVADRWGAFSHDRPAEATIEEDLATFDGKSFTVSRVVDGDTIYVHVGGPHAYDQSVRLLGVDTPETVKPHTPVQHYGREASDFTKKTLSDRHVTLQLDRKRTRDNYKRLLAYVRLDDGTDFDAMLIREGYGYADPRFAHPRKKEYLKLGDEARKAKRGLWKDLKPDDLPGYMKDKARP